MIGIYKITSPIGKIYIGQSRNISNRKATHKYGMSKNKSKLNDSFLKYGFDSHLFYVIEECSVSSLNDRERFWQDYYNVTGDNGLNECLNVGLGKGRVITIGLDNKIKSGLLKSFNKNHGNFRKKIILNTVTGIYYSTAEEAGNSVGMKSQYIRSMLTGHNRNKTNLIYV